MDMKRRARRAWKDAKKILAVIIVAFGGSVITLALKQAHANLGVYILGFAIFVTGTVLRSRWEG